MAPSILSALNQMAREAERAQKALQRQIAAKEKEQKRLHSESRAGQVEAMNSQLGKQLAELDGILAHALRVDSCLNLDLVKPKLTVPDFEPGPLADEGLVPSEPDYLPTPLGFFERLVPGATKRYECALEAGRERYRKDLGAWETCEADRKTRLAEVRAKHDTEVRKIKEQTAEQHRQVDRLRDGLAAGTPTAIVNYFTLVLERSSYPDTFPQHARVAYVPESKQLVVDYDLPAFDVVPQVRAYKYTKTRDVVSEVARPASERKTIYASVVTQVTVRTLHEIFNADRLRKLETVVFNGHVKSLDAATGKHVRPCVVSVRTTRAVFEELELSRVNPVACLTALNASLSKRPDELVPVRPVLDFNMVDPRFIQEADVLSGLDTRPNLMELTPSEFESLITNLFERMGLETRQTQASRDGGVDCVAYDPRPIFGGKVVIQAKRYSNTVGVSAVRDLFGTLQNEGASKGILVTTSGYGKAAFEFAKGKPIELLSGSNLLYLLAEHAGIEAKIVPPDDWKDPTPDAGV